MDGEVRSNARGKQRHSDSEVWHDAKRGQMPANAGQSTLVHEIVKYDPMLGKSRSPWVVKSGPMLGKGGGPWMRGVRGVRGMVCVVWRTSCALRGVRDVRPSSPTGIHTP